MPGFRSCFILEASGPAPLTPLVGQLHTMNTPATDELRYAGFWPRLGALLLDFLILLPLSAIAFWGSEKYRLFQMYYLLPGALFGLFYGVYLVRRYGGTPGKLI